LLIYIICYKDYTLETNLEKNNSIFKLEIKLIFKREIYSDFDRVTHYFLVTLISLTYFFLIFAIDTVL